MKSRQLHHSTLTSKPPTGNWAFYRLTASSPAPVVFPVRSRPVSALSGRESRMELSYVIITPYSIRKSRTGGILSRILSRSGLELAAARMFAPSHELVNEFVAALIPEGTKRHQAQELLRRYILKNFAPDTESLRQRVLLLVLRGENAVLQTRAVTGHLVQGAPPRRDDPRHLR